MGFVNEVARVRRVALLEGDMIARVNFSAISFLNRHVRAILENEPTNAVSSSSRNYRETGRDCP
jgi:hypothetical protein